MPEAAPDPVSQSPVETPGVVSESVDEPVDSVIAAPPAAHADEIQEPEGTTLVDDPAKDDSFVDDGPGPVFVGAGAGAGKTKGRRRAEKEHRSFFRELPFLVLIAFVLALVLKAFVVQAFFIPSGSMETTLLVKDRVLVNKVGYKFHDPHRGDIVVFNGKHTNFPPETVVAPATNAIQSAARKVQRFLGLGAPGERDYIKRVIAVGGDTIQCCTNGHVVVNGKELNETYLYQDNQLPFCISTADTKATVPASGPPCTAPDAKPFVVPKGTLFVMGDHRSLSADSRYEGVIPKSSVIGRAFVLVWPFSRFDSFGTPPTFS